MSTSSDSEKYMQVCSSWSLASVLCGC